MGRSLLIVALLYGCGHPSLDGYRPGALDRPLRDFHRAVDQAGTDSRRAVRLLDDARSMRYLASGLSRLNAAF